MHALKALIVASTSLALLSCAAQQKPVEIKSAQAMGTVGGLVLDAVTREPLAGVNVTLLAGGVPSAGTTDATGAFTFAQVPSGDVAVTLDHSDYLSANLQGTLLGAGEYPINNASLTFGPIGMIPSSGTFSALLLFDNGAPAGSVTVTARATTRFYDYGNWNSSSGYSQYTAVTAQSDASGLVSFTGLPDFVLLGDGDNDTISVIVPPIAAAAGSSSLYTYPGGIFSYHMNAVASITPLIILKEGTPTTLQVLASNIQSLEASVTNPIPSIIAQGGPVYVTFNQALNPDATTVVLLDEGKPGELSKDQTAVVQKAVSYNTLMLTFSPELTASSEYNLVIHAASGTGDQLIRGDFVAPFFTAPTATVLKPAMTREVIDAVNHIEAIHLVFAEPIGTGNAATNIFQNNDCVLFFNVELSTTNTTPGDDPGEIGNPECLPNIVLQAEEPDPQGLSGLSGYTKYWKFNLPILSGPSSVPVGTQVNIVFSRVATSAYTMRRVNGQAVPDFVGTQNLVLP